MPLWTAVRPDTRPRLPTPPPPLADRRSTTVVYPSPPRCAGSPLAAAQPNYQTAHQQHGRQSQQKAEADHARLQRREHQAGVARGRGGNGDQFFVGAQPIDDVHAEIEIADVAKISDGKKIAVAYHHRALLLGLGVLVGGGGGAGEIDAEGDGSADVLALFELHLAVERAGLPPAARAGLQQGLAFPRRRRL